MQTVQDLLDAFCMPTLKSAGYERIQDDIFDHPLASMPDVGLALYRRPLGQVVRTALAVGCHAPAAPQHRRRSSGGREA